MSGGMPLILIDDRIGKFYREKLEWNTTAYLTEVKDVKEDYLHSFRVWMEKMLPNLREARMEMLANFSEKNESDMQIRGRLFYIGILDSLLKDEIYTKLWTEDELKKEAERRKKLFLLDLHEKEDKVHAERMKRSIPDLEQEIDGAYLFIEHLVAKEIKRICAVVFNMDACFLAEHLKKSKTGGNFIVPISNHLLKNHKDIKKLKCAEFLKNLLEKLKKCKKIIMFNTSHSADGISTVFSPDHY